MEIMMKDAGYKKEKPEGNVQPVAMVDKNEPEYCYPIQRLELKECPAIDVLEQGGMYEMRALIRVKSKSSGDKKSYDGGGNAELEYHKIGFAPVKKGKKPAEMDDKELEEKIEGKGEKPKDGEYEE